MRELTIQTFFTIGFTLVLEKDFVKLCNARKLICPEELSYCTRQNI